jgi:tryptophan synthase beta chain
MVRPERGRSPGKKKTTLWPDTGGRFGKYGGRYVPETLIGALEILDKTFREALQDENFERELGDLHRFFGGRPTPLFRADRLERRLGKGVRLYLKREDLVHTGAHKLNNALGQILLARRMGKTRIVAETGAGQHGVATAACSAKLGMSCKVYMGEVDMARQELNVFRMRLMGAEVVGVSDGQRTLKDACNAAIRDWIGRPDDTHYLLGSALGPHPYPWICRHFQSVIGREVREQFQSLEGRKSPNWLVACVGGGSNAIGLFHEFLDDSGTRMVGVEAGGHGRKLGEHAARFRGGRPGVLQGCLTRLLQDRDGQIASTASISAGLDYPAVGPEHAHYADLQRIEFAAASDKAALRACRLLCQDEGILPALESSHAIAWILDHPRRFQSGETVVLNLSGRGDKDVPTLMKEMAL